MINKGPYLRVISDVHGHYDEYLDIIKDADYSVQLGDFGFNYDCLYNVDHKRHRINLGNHENYNAANYYPHVLGNFGPASIGPFSFFFVRGEWSIDINQRISHERSTGVKSWWSEEELDQNQMKECLKLYKEVKPDVVLSHGCPASISEEIGNPGVWAYFGWNSSRTSNTQILLEEMFNFHQPKLHIFAHFHRDWISVVNGTTFICMKELGYIDFNKHWEMV